MPTRWAALLILNAVMFTGYLHWRGYTQRLWLGALAGLVFGPFVWAYGPLVVWSDKRRCARSVE